MMIVYLEFPNTYLEMLSIVKKFAYLNYQDVSETIDHYLEQLIRLEVMRRKYDIAYPVLRDIFGEIVAKYPIITDDSEHYFNRRAIEVYLHHSTRLWGLVEEELTMLPSSDFLLWHVDLGIWKMYTTGVTHVGE